MRNLKSPRTGVSAAALQAATLAVVLALPLVAPAKAQAQTAPAADPAATQIDDVIVTARRRDESLQDVPSAVSTYGAELLENRGATDLRSLSGIIPNVNVQNGTTSSSSSQIFLRGIGIDNTGFNIDPAVGVYVDDIFVGRLIGSNINTSDVERIEALRGPQGTLYGRSSTAGTIKYVMRKPDVTDFGGRVSATIGTDERRDFSATLNVPLILDTLAVRLNLQSLDQGGYMTLLDAAGNDTGIRGNGTDRQDARLSIRYLPTDAITIDLSADWTRDRSGIQSLTPINCNSLPLVPGILGSGLPGLISAGQFSECPLLYPNQRYTAFVGPYPADDPQFNSHSLAGVMTWELGFGTLKAVSGYRAFDDVFAASLFAAPPPNFQVNLRQATDQSQFQQEFQFVSPENDTFNYVAGVFYFREDISVNYASQIGSLATLPYRNNDEQISESYAVYGEMYYRPVPELELTLGGRYSQDERSVDRVLLFSPYTTPAGTFQGSLESSDFSPRISVSYDLGSTLIYGTYSEGYRPQGYINTSPAAAIALGQSYEQETEQSYEIGFKTELFDNRFTWNLALFQAEYANLGATLTVAGNTIAVTSDADIRGLESEMIFRPADGLSFFFNAALLDTSYSTPPPGQPYAVELKHAPPETFTVGGNYNWAWPSIPGEFAIGADVTYTAAAWRNVANTVSNRSPAYTLAAAHVKYFSPDGRWTVTAGGTNLLDEEYYMLGTQNRALAYQPGRRVFVNVAATF